MKSTLVANKLCDKHSIFARCAKNSNFQTELKFTTKVHTIVANFLLFLLTTTRKRYLQIPKITDQQEDCVVAIKMKQIVSNKKTMRVQHKTTVIKKQQVKNTINYVKLSSHIHQNTAAFLTITQ